jgi:Lamin Tail Domain
LKRTIIGVLCGLTVLALVPGASAAVKITKIYFDSPGSDTGSNSSLNAEWIKLRNFGSRTRKLTDWTIRDSSAHVYTFGTFRLGPGDSVRVHTGKGTNTATNRYWRSDAYIWNNDGDTATLKKPGGTVVDRCSYSGAGSSVAC